MVDNQVNFAVVCKNGDVFIIDMTQNNFNHYLLTNFLDEIDYPFVEGTTYIESFNTHNFNYGWVGLYGNNIFAWIVQYKDENNDFAENNKVMGCKFGKYLVSDPMVSSTCAYCESKCADCVDNESNCSFCDQKRELLIPNNTCKCKVEYKNDGTCFEN